MDVEYALVPGRDLRYSLSDAEWNTVIEVWILLTHHAFTILDKKESESLESAEKNKISEFVISYIKAVHEDKARKLSDQSRSLLINQTLRRNCFLLLYRLYQADPPGVLLDLEVILKIAENFGDRNLSATRTIIDTAVLRTDDTLEDQIDVLLAALSSSSHAAAWPGDVCWNGLDSAEILTLLVPACSGTLLASYFTRPKLVTVLMELYKNHQDSKILVKRLTFVLATNDRVTLKFLNALIGSGEESPFLNTLLRKTSFVSKLKSLAETRPELVQIIEQVEELYRSPSFAISNNTKVIHDFVDEDITIKISQIADLFPDLDQRYISACLRNYGNDVETTTMHLLDGDIILEEVNERMNHGPTPSGRSDIPPTLPPRTNIFDGDQFDRLEGNTTKVTRGKGSGDADQLLRTGMSENIKSKVLALAFDSDDDEPDDTYDANEGVMVNDPHAIEDIDSSANANSPDVDGLLYSTYVVNASLFDKKARQTNARADLKARSGLSDEQIEGWKSMLVREPSRARRLAAAEELALSGNKDKLQSSKWTKNRGQDENGQDASDSDHISGDGVRGRGRGRGRGRRGSKAP